MDFTTFQKKFFKPVRKRFMQEFNDATVADKATKKVFRKVKLHFHDKFGQEDLILIFKSVKKAIAVKGDKSTVAVPNVNPGSTEANGSNKFQKLLALRKRALSEGTKKFRNTAKISEKKPRKTRKPAVSKSKMSMTKTG